MKTYLDNIFEANNMFSYTYTTENSPTTTNEYL